jgi:hypothetical protein
MLVMYEFRYNHECLSHTRDQPVQNSHCIFTCISFFFYLRCGKTSLSMSSDCEANTESPDEIIE